MILALDTSAAVAVSLLDGDDVRASRTEHAPRGHAELLSGLIRDCMEEAGCARGDIGSIVVGTGPAPFTGLRVGLVTARTLGFAWGVPVHGTCSLDAIGAALADQVELTVVSDARRKELYWATYREGERVAGPDVAHPADVPVVGALAGPGAGLYPEALPGGTVVDVDPAWLARVVARRLAAGETDLPTEPLYLRRPDVHGIPGA
ncbi:tRNA (adenosine(37)-N6)-threonylcarbamoyltransferase complex dimerization subunit type 1 TsaB [Demequina capsici]|uniref:tRNA (Adenosine(37)-N6)-threonylcarbamoyltransferase complex dimerization subunit type 1 TsaB n=1 Tax=Demequina capsici TaxID=3075620 RepID=A0AA96F9U9_9MICO|nr:tRNA (adenosine(37)-N6)-threonylcarbamoyltransferase complex dimerization subunit type 1 TsaB [Demequina sp. PMTSA13]WNM26841.1 tRNA (adenosine(37)-N6)-threonylcarbamoyltransferase complex dimerization subunit type 1 TsaB [Demequina sp. PMTSA13]